MKEIKRERNVCKRSQLYEIWLRMRKNKQAIFGLGLFICILLIAILADVLMDYNTDTIRQDITNRLQPPNAAHWLGTDQYGWDVLTRLIYEARISLIIGAITVFVSLVISGLIGAITGFYGGKLDNVSMRIMDTFPSLPSIFLTIVIVAALGTGIVNVMVAVVISCVSRYTRIIRSSILSIRDKEFIETARAIGTWDDRAILKSIIPNTIGPVVIRVTLGVGKIIMPVAGLSFLGLGISPPMPEWGAMLSGSKGFIRSLPYLVVFPGVCIVLTVPSLSPLGGGLRDVLDPQLK